MLVEWAKSKARVDRWCEEVQLLNEEMRRIICYLDWKANWWVLRRRLRGYTTPEVKHGLDAYAAKQADLNRQLARSFASRWYPLLTKHSMPIVWPEYYLSAIVTPSDTTTDTD
jgi:hypothetical protein